MKVRLFIGSSVEWLAIAHAVQSNLQHDAEVTVWPQSVFQLGITALESLLREVNTFDFAVFVFSPDDVASIRDESHPAVRDNVIFELGLFIGLTSKRVVAFYVTKACISSI